MYVAKWEDKLTGKVKYVWFSDSAFLKQNREKEKFKKAETLGKQIGKIEDHILRNLDDKDESRRKVATVAWLILKPNMRVGDEQDPDYRKSFAAKMANLKVAEVANHKRKIPPTFDERVTQKEARLKELKAKLEEKKAEGKKTDAFAARVEKARLDLDLMKRTKEYNLGTSLKSYIDP